MREICFLQLKNIEFISGCFLISLGARSNYLQNERFFSLL